MQLSTCILSQKLLRIARIALESFPDGPRNRDYSRGNSQRCVPKPTQSNYIICDGTILDLHVESYVVMSMRPLSADADEWVNLISDDLRGIHPAAHSALVTFGPVCLCCNQLQILAPDRRCLITHIVCKQSQMTKPVLSSLIEVSVLDSAWEWLCKRGKDYPASSDI